MAKGGILGAGIFFIIIAGAGFVIPISEGYTFIGINDLCSSGFGQLGQAFSGEMQKNCSQYKMVSYGIYGAGILGLVLIIVGAVVPGNKRESTSTREVEDDALDILEKRYAKGEISKDEFDKMKKDLE